MHKQNPDPKIKWISASQLLNAIHNHVMQIALPSLKKRAEAHGVQTGILIPEYIFTHLQDSTFIL